MAKCIRRPMYTICTGMSEWAGPLSHVPPTTFYLSDVKIQRKRWLTRTQTQDLRLKARNSTNFTSLLLVMFYNTKYIRTYSSVHIYENISEKTKLWLEEKWTILNAELIWIYEKNCKRQTYFLIWNSRTSSETWTIL